MRSKVLPSPKLHKLCQNALTSCNCRSTSSNKSRTDSLKIRFSYRLFFVTQKAIDQNQEKTNNHQVISLSQKREKEEFTN